MGSKGDEVIGMRRSNVGWWHGVSMVLWWPWVMERMAKGEVGGDDDDGGGKGEHDGAVISSGDGNG